MNDHGCIQHLKPASIFGACRPQRSPIPHGRRLGDVACNGNDDGLRRPFFFFFLLSLFLLHLDVGTLVLHISYRLSLSLTLVICHPSLITSQKEVRQLPTISLHRGCVRVHGRGPRPVPVTCRRKISPTAFYLHLPKRRRFPPWLLAPPARTPATSQEDGETVAEGTEYRCVLDGWFDDPTIC